MTPIIILAGQAGSGKDTVGAYLAKHYNAITIGQADPMKRFVRDVFSFSTKQLWGESEFRNQEVHFTLEDILRVQAKFKDYAGNLVREIVPEDRREVAMYRFEAWIGAIVGYIELNSFNLSARYVLQKLGTDWGRYVSKEMWSLYSIKVAQALLGGDMSYSREYGLVGAQGTAYDYVAITDGRFRNELVNVSVAGGLTVLVKRAVTDLNGELGQHASEKELGGIPLHFYAERLDNQRDFDYLYSTVDDMMAINFGDMRVIQERFITDPNLQ